MTDMVELNFYRVLVEDVPFQWERSRQALFNLNSALNGVAIFYYPPSEQRARHDILLNLEVKEGPVFIGLGSGSGFSLDNAFAQIISKIENKCVKQGLPLVVSDLGIGESRKEFTVLGDAMTGFVFRPIEAPKPALKTPKLDA